MGLVSGGHLWIAGGHSPPTGVRWRLRDRRRGVRYADVARDAQPVDAGQSRGARAQPGRLVDVRALRRAGDPLGDPPLGAPRLERFDGIPKAQQRVRESRELIANRSV